MSGERDGKTATGTDVGSRSQVPVAIADARTEVAAGPPTGGGGARRETVVPGTRLGRYVLVERIGAGGMGVVYAAHDPDLDRKIAIKLLHPDVFGEINSSHGEARLRREAQALARLSHPNVVAVYDYGLFEQQVFVAMEYVDGRSLGAWLAESPRGWQEIVEVYAQAGRALAAAHALGIVHRDFKPDNAMIDRGGRVRVLDFGLARAVTTTTGDSSGSTPVPSEEDGVSADEPADSRRSPFAAPLTRAGGAVGTPRYMAPEQHEGRADARSDQFSYAVALYEALYGEPPFPGFRRKERLDAIALNRVRTPPKGTKVPVWLRQALLVALRAEPGERHLSMDALLSALARDPRERNRRRVVVGVGAAVGVAAAIAMPTAYLASRGTRRVAAPPQAPPPLAVDPASARPLTRMGGCAFSPVFADARTIVFDHTVREGSHLYTLAAGDDTPRAVPPDGVSEWRASPGPRPGVVVFVHSEPSGDSLVLYDIATNQKTPVGVESAFPSYLGESLLYGNSGRTQIRRVDGHTDHAFVTVPDGSMVMGIAAAPPDHIAVVLMAATTFMRLCRVVGESGTLDCAAPPGLLPGRPAFGDGGALYYPTTSGVARVGQDRLVAPGVIAAGGLVTSPDNSRLVYSTCRDFAHIVSVDGSGTTTRFLDDPDLSRVAAGPGGKVAILRRDGKLSVLSGGVEREVMDSSRGTLGQFSFKGNGSLVAVTVTGPNGGIFTGWADGSGSPRRITSNPTDTRPFYYDDDRRLAFERTIDGRPTIVTIAADGADERPGPINRRLKSSDGGNNLLVQVGTGTTIALHDMTTGHETELTAPPLDNGDTVFSAHLDRTNGDVIAQLGSNGERLWRVPLHGKATLLHEMAPGENTREISVDPQGRILLPILTWQGELYELDAPPGRRF
jgi:hypothetical protein